MFQLFQPLLMFIILPINSLLRKVVLLSHYVQHRIQWKGPHTPEWYDHYLDLYFQWPYRQNPFWVESGVYSALCIKPQSQILEMCCGDGFNSKHFYAIRCKSLTSIDFDKTAIAHARKYNSHKKGQFILGDIRKDLPDQKYDNIVWDAAIEHFTEIEIAKIMESIKKRLCPEGILSGYTIVELPTGEKQLHQHEYEFKSKEDLYRFLDPWFKNIRVFETIYPERHNLYFYASDGTLPFDRAWSAGMSKN